MSKKINATPEKMAGKKLLVVFTAIVVGLNVYAQDKNAQGQLPSVGAGAGVLIFKGDIGKGSDLSTYSIIRAGYNFSVEQRIGKFIGISATGLFGKLAQSERSKTSNYNFESKIMQGDISIILHTDKLLPDANLTPYVGVGIGFLKFDSYGDLKDKNGLKYYYWSDGSIHDLSETAANMPLAKTLQRDYTYETQLKDSTTTYARNTLVIPLTFGFNLKLLDNLEASLGATYFITFTDYIDNIKANSNNDSYLYTRVGLTYTFLHGEKKAAEDKRYEKVDFSKIDEGDSDGDGIKDSKDNCAGTPKGTKVDSDGCPLDTDKDGVPDYLDKEPDSKKGAIVDASGVTQTDQILAKKQAEWDAAATERSETFNGTKKGLPPEFLAADYNKDGFIQVTEINQVIDGFFTGENDFTVERINRLIDFFFEQ
jgi:hypothetical protein